MLRKLYTYRINIIACLFLTAITITAYFPIIRNINQPILGWGRYYILALPLSQSILDYHQLPFRTHLFSGGYPVIADIEGWNLGPFGIFLCFFREIIGVRLIVLSYLLMGATGMFYFTRSIMKYNYLGAVYSSVLFICCPWIAYRIIGSDLYYLSMCFLPFFIAFFIKSFTKPKYLIFASIILSLYIFSAGLNFIIVCLFTFLYVVLKTFDFNNKNNPLLNCVYLKNFVLLIIFVLLLSSIKIIPMLNLINSRQYQYFHNSSEVEQSYGVVEANKDGQIEEALSERCWTINKLQNSLFKKEFKLSQDLSIYFGYIPVFLLIIAMLFYSKKLIHYFLLLFIFIILMFGPNSIIDIYKPLWSINSFTRGIVKPDRYFLPYIFFLTAVISGQSFSLIDRIKRRYLYAGLLCLLAIVSIYDVFRFHHSILDKIRYLPKEQISEKAANNFFQIKFYQRPDEIHYLNIKQDDDFWCYPLFRQNIGIVNFYPTVDIGYSAIPKYFIDEAGAETALNHINRFYEIEHMFKVNPEYKGETFFLQKQNNLNLLYYSPDKILIDTKIITPDKLIVNQNYHKGWKSNKGKIDNYRGLLAIDVDVKDKGIIKLDYFPVDLLVGLIGTILGIVVLFLYSLLFGKV